jgi:intein/homing endonuclease
MALPTSGLNLNMIKQELGITTTSNLDYCLSLASKYRPGKMSDFYGYSHYSGGGGGTIQDPIYDDTSCFKSGTLITLPDLQKVKIEELCPGYTLTTFHIDGMIDEKTPGWEGWTTKSIQGNYMNVTVNSNVPSQYHYYYIITLESGTKLEVTYEHPLFVLRDGLWQWVEVRNLLLTDKLFSEYLNEVGMVSIERVDEEETFWKLDVEETDTYFAGGILAHNSLQAK